MIVRILGDDQYSVPDDQHDTLTKLDDDLARTVDEGDEAGFTAALGALVAEVRRSGTPLAADDFSPSDLVVPFTDATLEETKGLLAGSGDSSGTDDS